ncbi:MAG: NAD(P)/FAD-dependent oxidoreductase [Bacteroidia bacterium]|nr:NAD(P)/FAD-dependent oxidoreductase [Bacteroidia bacterium]
MSLSLPVVIVGGGAAGCFAAIAAKEKNPNSTVYLLEKSNQLLSKVKISGGGRCNVTHHCFDPVELVKNYPRGNKELLSAFTRFGPLDTIRWFENRGVTLKTEADGRIFPATDKSETIVNCLITGMASAGVKIVLNAGLEKIQLLDFNRWQLEVNKQGILEASHVLVATGSSTVAWELYKNLGLQIEPPVPSLFTFHIPDNKLQELAGISLSNVQIQLINSKIKSSGAILFTHWGISGPSVLKLSAWAARELAQKNYQFTIQINWLSTVSQNEIQALLQQTRQKFPRKQISNLSLAELPNRFWNWLLRRCQIAEEQTWGQLTKQEMQRLLQELTSCMLEVSGKSTFKEEFVTCGGISRKEINFQTMACKRFPNLFAAGECIDIDAVTGGFNFQAAWTTGKIAGENLVSG